MLLNGWCNVVLFRSFQTQAFFFHIALVFRKEGKEQETRVLRRKGKGLEATTRGGESWETSGHTAVLSDVLNICDTSQLAL